MGLSYPDVAAAQSGTSSGDGQTHRLVLLDVPGGGTDKLQSALEEVGSFEFKHQAWFVQQIRKRAIEAKGIMGRPDDLKWLMQQAEVDYILFLAPADQSTYRANLVEPSTGKPGMTTTVDRTNQGLSSAGSRLIATEIED